MLDEKILGFLNICTGYLHLGRVNSIPILETSLVSKMVEFLKIIFVSKL